MQRAVPPWPHCVLRNSGLRIQNLGIKGWDLRSRAGDLVCTGESVVYFNLLNSRRFSNPKSLRSFRNTCGAVS